MDWLSFVAIGVSFFFFSVIRKDTRGAQQPFPPKYNENTFKAVQSTFRSLETFSKRRCKICICLVIQGELESSLLQKGWSIIFDPYNIIT